MRSKLPLLLVAAAALLVAALFALGLPQQWLGAGGRAGGGEDSGADLSAGGAGAPDATAGAEATRGPRLVGSESLRRRGLGAVRGRVLDARTGKGVAGATLLLTGTGYGKEVVAARAASAADGTFAWLDVAAGAGHALRVEAPGLGARSMPGIDVAAGQSSDLGDIWLGKSGVVLGKVLDAAGQPVAKAVVELHRGATSLREFFLSGGFLEFFRNLDREPEPLLRQESRSDGGFRFEPVSPGPHTLLVRAPGLRQTLATVTLTGEGATEEVTVRLGQGSTLTGSVVDAQGRALAGVKVVAMSQDADMATPLARLFATSRDDGSFRFDTLPDDGNLMLIASLAGYPNTLAQVEQGGQAVRIVMKRGATLEIRLVRDADGSPIEGAEVLCSVGEGESVGSEGPGTLMPGTTDRGGAVVFEAPPGVLQMLIVSHPERPPGFWMNGRGMRMPGMLKGPEDAKVPEGRREMTFRAADGVWVTGRVLDGDKRPVAGAEVSVMGFMGGGQKGLSGADGSFRIAADRTMSASLRATLPGWVQEKVEYGDTSGLRDPEATEVKADILMRAAVTVAGRVLDASGKPLAGATVMVNRVKANEERSFDMGDMFGAKPSSLTLSDGSYVVDGVPAGRKVRVLARRTGYVDGGTEAFEAAESGVTNAPVLRMPAGLSVALKVEAGDGRPVAGARVRVSVERSDGVEGDQLEQLMGQGSGQDEVRTDASGQVRIELLPPGTLTLRVSAAGHAPWGAKHKLTGEAGDALTIRLPPGIALAGTVLDGQGQPLHDARVQIVNGEAPAEGDAAQAGEWQQDWDRSRRAQTDREGRWRVADLPDRPLRVRVAKEGFRTKTQDVGQERGAIQVRLEEQTKDATARIAEIDAELQKLYTRVGGKGDDQQALLQQINELQRERRDLAGDDG